MTISLAERYGDTIMSGADGEALRAEVAGALLRDESITFDFKGVALILSAFLNPAIGSLYEEFPADLLDARIHDLNASELQHSSFEAVKDRARRYYNDAPAQRRREAAVEDLLAG